MNTPRDLLGLADTLKAMMMETEALLVPLLPEDSITQTHRKQHRNAFVTSAVKDMREAESLLRSAVGWAMMLVSYVDEVERKAS